MSNTLKKGGAVMKTINLTGWIIGLMLFTSSAHAVSLKLDTVRTIGSDGASIIRVASIISVTGLGNFSAPSLAAFDLDFFYEPSVLDLRFVQIGAGLGDPDNRTVFFGSPPIPPVAGVGEAIADAALLSSGQVNIFNVSLLESDAVTCFLCLGPFLDDLQPSEFILTALSFDVLKDSQTTALGLSSNALSDAFGNTITPEMTSVTRSVSTAPLPIPEPGTVLLFGSGFVGFMAWRWKKSRVRPC